MSDDPHSKVLLSDLLDCWLEDLQNKIRPTSFTVYQSQVQNHILPELGNLKLDEITPHVGEGLMSCLMNKGLSAQTSKDIAGKLSQALRWGVDQGYNVPILKQVPNRWTETCARTLTDKEEKILDQYLTHMPDSLKKAVVLAWKAGLTIGEVCALTWADLDMEQKRIKVSRLCQRVHGGLAYLDEDARYVPIPVELDVEAYRYGGHVVRSSRGEDTEPRLCQIWLKKFLSEENLSQDITYAVLRNTYIRTLMEKGIDFIEVSRLSGCRDLNDLWKKYGDFYRVDQDRAV